MGAIDEDNTQYNTNIVWENAQVNSAIKGKDEFYIAIFLLEAVGSCNKIGTLIGTSLSRLLRLAHVKEAFLWKVCKLHFNGLRRVQKWIGEASILTAIYRKQIEENSSYCHSCDFQLSSKSENQLQI